MSWIDWINIIISYLVITVYGLAIIIGVGYVIGLWIPDKIDNIKEKQRRKKLEKKTKVQ